LKLGRDGWAGLAVLIAGLVLFGLTLGLKGNPMVPIGPGFYPRIVLGVTIVLSAWLVVADWISLKRQAPPSAQKLNYGLVALMFAVFGLYAGALAYLGFRVSTLLYVAAANALLDPPRGPKGWARVALVAAITTVVVYVVFERYLLVLLPRGRWTSF
jgi:putative tricarboxylic transport membrane protein